MCAGIRDVSNLAWKIAYCLKNNHDEKLLNTYQSERYSNVKEYIKTTAKMGEFVNAIGTSNITGEVSSTPDGKQSMKSIKPKLGKGLGQSKDKNRGKIFPQFNIKDGKSLDVKFSLKPILILSKEIKKNISKKLNFVQPKNNKNLETFFETYDFLPRTLLDLGCGYGYLACESRRFNFLNIFATDNNAAAIAACRLNFNHYGLNAANVLATDAGQKIVGNFDVILCNPPIHAGFRVDSALILKFLSSTQHLITKTGKALFVVDVCTPLELLAKNNFSRIHILNKNNRFKLISLSH